MERGQSPFRVGKQAVPSGIVCEELVYEELVNVEETQNKTS
jgi:hypothetical protein